MKKNVKIFYVFFFTCCPLFAPIRTSADLRKASKQYAPPRLSSTMPAILEGRAQGQGCDGDWWESDYFKGPA